MNWTFWTRTKPTETDDCAALDALLSLYADGAASPEEALRVEAHLPDCAACRESLAWMRATRLALAARPVVAPPADLRARIAEAIAASSDVPVPAAFRTRPAFALRPTLAAAASVAMLGIVSYNLLHHPSAAVHPVMPPQMASDRPVAPAPVVKTVPGVKMRLTPRPAAMPKHTRLDPDRIALSQPAEDVPSPAVVKRHPQVKAGVGMLADAAPALAPVKPQPAVVRKPTLRTPRPEMMATNKSLAPSAETHKVPVIRPEPKHADTAVAEAPHAQTLSTPAIIEKPPVITPDPAPVVAVASNGGARLQTAEEHGIIRLRNVVGTLGTFTHTTLARADRGAIIATTMIDQDKTPGFDITHGSGR